MYQPEYVTATGDALDLGTTGATGALGGASLLGAGTAVIRSGGSGGPVIAHLGAGAGLADHFMPIKPIPYTTKVHVTMATGTLVLYKA